MFHSMTDVFEIEDLHAVLDARRQRLVAAGIGRRDEADGVRDRPPPCRASPRPGVSRVMIMPGAMTAPVDVVDAEGEVAVVRRPEQPGDERQQSSAR